MEKSNWTIDTLKEHLLTLIEKNDRIYKEKFIASEKAETKSEASQKAFNERSNEFRQALDDSNKTKIDRTEVRNELKNLNENLEGFKVTVDKTFDEVKKDINNLRESRSKGYGKDESGSAHTHQRNWSIGIAVAVILGFISTIISIIGLFK